MSYYCLNDRFAYCTGQPQKNERTGKWKVVPPNSNESTGIENKLIPCCDLKIATCGLYQKASEK